MILNIHNNVTTMKSKDELSASGMTPQMEYASKLDYCTNDVFTSAEMREQIRIWLAAPNPSPNYQAARRQHLPETGKWLIEGSHFRDWKKFSGSFLRLHGLRMLLRCFL